MFDEEMGFKVVVEAGDVQKWLAVDGLEVEGVSHRLWLWNG